MRAVNLIPAEQRGGAPVGAGRSGGVAYAVLGVLGGIAVLALLYGIASHQVSSRTSQVASLNARASAAQASAAQLAPYTSFISLRQARVQAVEELVDSRFDWAHAFHEFARVLPADASLSSVSGTIGSTTSASGTSTSTSTSSTAGSTSGSSTGGATVTSATPPGSVPSFTVTGCAKSQEAVAETIDRLRLIDGVSAVTLTSSTRSAATGGTAGGCGANAPTFTLDVVFQPLPATSAAAAAATARTVADTAKAASAAPAAPSAASQAASGGQNR